MPSIEELLQEAIDEGVTCFELSQELEDDGTLLSWHWDVYSEDPHKWFGIIKPWTIRLLWLGWKNKNINRLFGFLPFCFYWDRWTFTYYKGAKYMGCQMAMNHVPLAKGLAFATNHYKCDKYCSPPLNTDKWSCDGCKYDVEED